MTINIGDVFYGIVPTKSLQYRSECRVCEGKKELTVNGITFRCPQCHQESVTLSVNGYEVRCFKVYGIDERANNDYWNLGNKYKKYHLFTKRGRGQLNTCGFNANGVERSVNGNWFINYLNTENCTEHIYKEVFFDDYKLAVKTAERLTEKEINKVREFNETHGTKYELPVFEIEHDKK